MIDLHHAHNDRLRLPKLFQSKIGGPKDDRINQPRQLWQSCIFPGPVLKGMSSGYYA